MKKLGEILLQDGLISQGQLDKALKRQVTAGGRLGTNLVEMMLLDDVRLGQILSRQSSIPDVHPKVLESIDQSVLPRSAHRPGGVLLRSAVQTGRAAPSTSPCWIPGISLWWMS